MDVGAISWLLVAVYIIINISSLLIMVEDKKRSRGSERRISEATLLFAAICFGALGIYLGMFLARHKTRKLVFAFGVPLALLENLSFFYALYVSLC